MIKIQGDFVLFFMQNCCIDLINFAITIDTCLVDLIYIVYFPVFRLQYHSKEKELRQIQSRNVKLNISYQFHLLGFTSNLSQRFDLCVKGAHQLIINHS